MVPHIQTHAPELKKVPAPRWKRDLKACTGLRWLIVKVGAERNFKIHNIGKLCGKRWKFCCYPPPVSGLVTLKEDVGGVHGHHSSNFHPTYLTHNDPPHLLPRQFLIPAHFYKIYTSFFSSSDYLIFFFSIINCQSWSLYGIFLASQKYHRSDVSGRKKRLFGSFQTFV